MAFEDLYRLLDIRDAPHAKLDYIYKQYYALKQLYQMSNRRDIIEVCNAMKEAMKVFTDPGRRAAYDAEFLTYRKELTPLWALKGFDDIQHYQKPHTNLLASATVSVCSNINSTDQLLCQTPQDFHPSLDQAFSELGNDEKSSDQPPGNTSVKFAPPWGWCKSSMASSGFIQYTNEDYTNHVQWSESVEEKKVYKGTKSKGSNIKIGMCSKN